ncbi:MAG: DUF2118 domain-containing protein, partial [Paracoccaceae bacterium]|nr:DUF2118 domain-containing protein [Paracoccaceae bacterium]
HNLPFVAAVMGHARFRSGNITTAFIDEEYPQGFQGAILEVDLLKQVAASAASMHRLAEIRRTRITGTLNNRERKVGDDWVVTLQGEKFSLKVVADAMGSDVHFLDGSTMRVTSDWTPGQPLVRLMVGGEVLVMKQNDIPCGYRLRLRGAELKCLVQSPQEAALAMHMLEKLPPDMSGLLLCPMPGLLVSLAVAEGDEVQEGQTLATVEAMKMENILKAERAGVVKIIQAKAGASLRVDDVIMEFE